MDESSSDVDAAAGRIALLTAPHSLAVLRLNQAPPSGEREYVLQLPLDD